MKIFYVLGKSGTGKSTIQAALLKYEFGFKVEPLVEYTDRPKRAEEKKQNNSDDRKVTQVFVSNDEFEKILDSKDTMESRSYIVTDERKFSYATPYPEKDGVYIGSGGLKAFESIKTYIEETKQMKNVLYPIYLTCPPTMRLVRAIYREGNDANALKEVCRRFIADEASFDEYYLQDLGITKKNTFRNEESLTGVVGRIAAYVRRNVRTV